LLHGGVASWLYKKYKKYWTAKVIVAGVDSLYAANSLTFEEIKTQQIITLYSRYWQ